jgi:hypothetical protein
MVLSFQPIIARLRKKAFNAHSLAQAADATEVMEPGSVSEYSAIIELPDEVDRIIDFEKPSARDEYIRYRSNGRLVHRPTVARFYRQAIIANGAVYANQSFETISPSTGLSRALYHGRRESYSGQMLATSWVAEKYFGHWITDGLSLELLAQKVNSHALGISRKPWTHELGYRALVGMKLHRTALARVNGLWVVEDGPLNQGRANRMRELRRRIRLGAGRHVSDAPVFIRRDGGAARQLVNQDALADALARRGFKIISPERETVASLAQALGNAPLVISVEGSALCHAVMLMPENAAILAIQPPRRVTCIQKNNAEWAGLRMAHTVADDQGSGFSLSEDRLMRVCDLIHANKTA